MYLGSFESAENADKKLLAVKKIDDLNLVTNFSIKKNKPVGNGIITCLNMKQARDRKEKGSEAAKRIASTCLSSFVGVVGKSIILFFFLFLIIIFLK